MSKMWLFEHDSLDIWSNDSFLQLADMIMYKE